MCYITYRKSDCMKRLTMWFMESFLRLTVFVFKLPLWWYTCESWVLFAIADICCVAFICQLVCFLMCFFGLNPASYYIVYLSIVSLFFCITYSDNQSLREPSSFVLRRFLEAIGLKWYLLPYPLYLLQVIVDLWLVIIQIQSILGILESTKLEYI